MTRITLIALFFGSVGAITLFLAINPLHRSELSANEERHQSAGPHVAVVALGSLDSPSVIARFRGDVRARRQTQLAFRRSGRVIELIVDSGDVVKTGDRLGRLDVADLDAQQRIAEAQVHAAEAELAEAVAGPRPQTLQAAAAQVRSIDTQLQSAKNRLNRERALADRGAGIAQTLDDVQFDVDRLTASLQQSTAVLEELNEGTRSEQIAAAESRLELAKANLAKIDVDRTDSEIVAPYDAVVSARMIDEGAMVGPNQTVVTIVESSPLEAHFGLPSDVADSLQVGVKVDLVIGNVVHDRIFNGSDLELNPINASEYVVHSLIVRMSPLVDPVTRTRGVDVEFQPPSGSSTPAWIGQTATLLLGDANGSSSNDSFWVPSGALVRGVRGLWSLYVVNHDSLIEKHDVRIEKTIGNWSLVKGDVDAETLIVIDGTQRVGPGMNVVVQRQDQEGGVASKHRHESR